MKIKIFMITILLFISGLIYSNNLNIPDNEMERIIDAGILAGKAMFYNLDWNSFFLKFMEIERKKNWNEKQIAFIGIYFGAIQSKYAKQMEENATDNIEKIKDDLEKYMIKLNSIKFSDKSSMATDILWYDLCENKDFKGAVIYPVGEFSRCILIIQFIENKASFIAIERYSENLKIKEIKFNKRTWTKNKIKRIDMIKDVYTILQGKTKDEVREILGVEDGVYNRNYGYAIIENDEKQILEILDKWINVWKIKGSETIKPDIDNNNQNFDFVYIMNGKETSNNFTVSTFINFIKTDNNIKYIHAVFFNSKSFIRKIVINYNTAQIDCDLIFSKPETISDTFLIKLSADLIMFENKWIIKTVKFSPYLKYKLYKLGNIDINKVFYQTSIGMALYTNDKEIIISNEFKLFKIENNDDLFKFNLYLDSIIGINENNKLNKGKEMIKHMLAGRIQKDKKILVIISQKSNDLFIDQPYYLDDKNLFINEIKKTGPVDGHKELTEKLNYYFIRYIVIDKNDDVQLIIKELDKEIILKN